MRWTFCSECSKYSNLLFGIEDVYNKPGTSGDKNWSLRLPNNFEWFYFQQLAKGKAMNLAEVLLYALKVRGLDKENQELIEKLEKYAKIWKRNSFQKVVEFFKNIFKK